ncbi:MAG: site-specific integrase [Caldicoprobacterales bacterium]
MLDIAIIEFELIHDNPAKRVKNPPKPEKKIVSHYDDEETRKLLSALNQNNIPLKYKVAMYLIIFTGMRKAELMGLEWSDIDFKNNEITIDRGSQYDTNIGVYTSSTKNHSSKRTVNVPDAIMNLLSQYKAWQNKQRLKCGDQWHDHDRLFTQWNGKPAHPTSLNIWMRKFIHNNSLKPITPHGLRHTYASILMDQNIDVTAISEQLGHANKTTTLNIYSHKLKKKNKVTSDTMEKTLLEDTSSSKYSTP